MSGRTLRILGREITLAPSGLPERISTFYTPEMTGYTKTAQPVLAAPMRLEVAPAASPAGTSTSETTSGERYARTDSPAHRTLRFTRREPGTVSWVALTDAVDHDIEVRGTLEFDGARSCEVRLRAKRAPSLNDVRLTIPYAPTAATYAMGLGLTGQRRPASFDWRWDVAKQNQDGAWLGGVNAGLCFSLRAENYVRPLNTNFYLQKPLRLPPSWGNGGAGAVSWREQGNAVLVQASSGARTMAAGDSLRFDAHFLVTPFHPIDTDRQWGPR